jgi:YbgC/YbaW family acyl-CoA thioester hydrolase
MKTEIQIEVAREQTDEMGHLNHVQALTFLERARLDWYERCGLGREGGEEVLGTVVVNINVNYRNECFLGEKLSVRTRPVAMGTKSFVLAQEIVRPDGETAIDGAITSVVMDMTSRNIIAVPDCIASHFPSPSRS